jgi:hypothetical protein
MQCCPHGGVSYIERTAIILQMDDNQNPPLQMQHQRTPVHPGEIQLADEPHHRGSRAAFKNAAGREKSNLTKSDFPPHFYLFLGKIGQNRQNSSIVKIVWRTFQFMVGYVCICDGSFQLNIVSAIVPRVVLLRKM